MGDWLCVAKGVDRVDQRELAAWLALIADGDEQSFIALHRATAGRLYGLIVATVRDPDLAEDALQQVYVEVWRKAATYRRELGQPLSWLMMISRRRAIDLVRSEEVFRQRLDLYAALAVPSEPAADELVLRDCEHQEVRRAVDELTAVQRGTIDLVYFRGLSQAETAAALSITVPACKSRIRDGIIRLRSELVPA